MIHFWIKWELKRENKREQVQIVQIGAAHALPHDPSMTCSDFYPLLSVHLFHERTIIITQGKFETLCSVLLWWPFWWIRMHFGAFWCTSCTTPWPFHDLLWLLSSSGVHSLKIDHISHLEEILNTLICHDMVAILVHFGAIWCTSYGTPDPFYDFL